MSPRKNEIHFPWRKYLLGVSLIALCFLMGLTVFWYLANEAGSTVRIVALWVWGGLFALVLLVHLGFTYRKYRDVKKDPRPARIKHHRKAILKAMRKEAKEKGNRLSAETIEDVKDGKYDDRLIL